jgi:epoxyqueuosine reductase
MLTPDRLRARAGELGFDLCGIAPAGALPELTALEPWLEAGYGGTMAYLARTAEKRREARQVLPSAQSVVALGALYNTGGPYSTQTPDPGRALISRYAWGDDYHRVLEDRLRQLVAWMEETSGEPFESRFYVDTGPVQERVYAQHAGLGWIGKNTCLINPELGSWLFLAEILCSLPLRPDAPGFDRCGSCTLCLEACPTGAFVEPYVLDATRCISYLTIELKGSIPEPLREGVGARVYGCDVCQEVCPWNAAPPVSSQPEWQPRPGLGTPHLLDVWRRSDAELRRLLKGSAMNRAGVRGLRRNVAVAIGNCGDPTAATVFDEPRAPEQAPLAADPMVAEHVEWARRRLLASKPGRDPKPQIRDPGRGTRD